MKIFIRWSGNKSKYLKHMGVRIKLEDHLDRN